jgi:alkanesulfonate monooxygenase SsuD/methylene tetrahydromethanopterin reductase-like flavin-dependent oxidoreductase (luciferase family)
MHDQDGSVGRNGVEVGAGRVALFLKLRVIVAETDDDAVAFDDLAVLADPVMQNALQRRDVVAFAVGRRQEVRRKRLEPDHDDMAVRIDEARAAASCP